MHFIKSFIKSKLKLKPVLTTYMRIPSHKLWLLFLILAGGFTNSQVLAQGFITKKVDLSRYGSPSFIDRSQLTQKLVVGFQNCNLVILNPRMEVETSISIDKCGKLFKSRYGVVNSKDMISSAIYTGNSSLFDYQTNFSTQIHKAAVTDTFIVNNYLVSTSDDGSVQINILDDLLNRKASSRKIYRSIGVARNLAVFPSNLAQVPRVATGYDSGEIVILTLGKDISKKVESVSFHPLDSRINALKFFQNSHNLAVAYFTGDLILVDSKNGQTKQLFKTASQINSLDVNTKAIVAIGDDQGYVRLISAMGKVLEEHKISSVGITGLRFSDDQTILVTDALGFLYQYQLRITN